MFGRGASGTREPSCRIRSAVHIAPCVIGAVAGAQSTLFKQLDGSLKLEAINAITEAIQRTFLLTIVGAAIMTLAAACMRVEKIFDALPRPEESEATELPMP